jgi:molybdate transport system substrate-binding protein
VRRSVLVSLVSVLAAVSLLAVSCSSGGTSGGGSGSGGELVVLAAASLTDAFDRVGSSFEAANPGVKVTFSFGPSDGLATSIDQGAPADVFASASPSWMDDVTNNGPGVTDRANFARNRLVLVVPSDDPAGISSIADLARPGVRLVLAAEGVPAGDYARQILANAGIRDAALVNVVSNEEDVRGVLTKIVTGEADAGIVYVTDVTPDVAGQVRAIPIPSSVNVIATYPIAVVADSKEADLASRFVRYVLGPGQRTLRAFGFEPPPTG